MSCLWVAVIGLDGFHVARTYRNRWMGYIGYSMSMSDYPMPLPNNIESPGRLVNAILSEYGLRVHAGVRNCYMMSYLP